MSTALSRSLCGVGAGERGAHLSRTIHLSYTAGTVSALIQAPRCSILIDSGIEYTHISLKRYSIMCNSVHASLSTYRHLTLCATPHSTWACYKSANLLLKFHDTVTQALEEVHHCCTPSLPLFSYILTDTCNHEHVYQNGQSNQNSIHTCSPPHSLHSSRFTVGIRSQLTNCDGGCRTNALLGTLVMLSALSQMILERLACRN